MGLKTRIINRQLKKSLSLRVDGSPGFLPFALSPGVKRDMGKSKSSSS